MKTPHKHAEVATAWLQDQLAALETCVVYSPGTRFQIKNFDEVLITKSIKAIKEALAHPAQQQKIKRDTTVKDDVCPRDTDYHNE